MKVIILKDIDKLGKMGDVVTVKEGYARNFLIPSGKVKPATPGNMKILDSIKKKAAAEEAKIVAQAQAIADKISALSLTIEAVAGEEDKLFGSVSSDDISAGLAQEGVSIDKKDILVEEPIKKLGSYQVTVKLHPEVKASLRVWVIAKK